MQGKILVRRPSARIVLDFVFYYLQTISGPNSTSRLWTHVSKTIASQPVSFHWFTLNNDRTKFSRFILKSLFECIVISDIFTSIELTFLPIISINNRDEKKENRIQVASRRTTFVKTFKKKNRRSFRSRRVRLFTLETFTRCCESATFTVKREHDETSTLNGPRYFCSFSMPLREYDATHTHSPFNLHATR